MTRTASGVLMGLAGAQGSDCCVVNGNQRYVNKVPFKKKEKATAAECQPLWDM